MEGSNFKFEFMKHFINKKAMQQLLQLQNIQTIQKTPQILSDIVEKFKEKEEKFIYATMKKELVEVFSDFKYVARGNQGYVILAKEKQTNMRYAIKGCFIRDEEGKVEDEQDLNNAKKEIEILQQCRGSPYVSNFIKSIDLEKNQLLYLVFTEYQGTLQELIDGNQHKRLNEISAIKYSIDIAEGLLYIHGKGYLVNDLKMDNILIDYIGNAVVSDFGYAQKVKKDAGYTYKEYEGNLYYQAPECVDREIVKLYEDEYKKLDVVTQVNPSQRSEACSFGYLIYTMVQGKKDAYKFMYEKHKPLVYDDNFKSFKYSQQLQKIIDGLTKFIPKERLSIKEALQQLKELIPIEINLDMKLQILVSEQTQKSSQNEMNGIEFIETFNKQYYPIFKNEDSFLKDLVEQPQKELQSFLADYENLKKTLKEREKQIQEIQVASQENLQKKDQEIMNLKEKLQTKDQKVENLENQLQYLQNLNLTLLQKQDNLQADSKLKDEQIFQIQEQLQTQTMENEKLKNNIYGLEIQKECFLENQERAKKKIEELEKNIKECQERAQQKIQELEEIIKFLETQFDKNKIYDPQQLKTQEFQKNIIPEKMMRKQQSMTYQSQMFFGQLNQQASTSQSLVSCKCKIRLNCQKACAKCGHKFCGRGMGIEANEGIFGNRCGPNRCGPRERGNLGLWYEGCCNCKKTRLGQTCSLGCKCDYCQ